MNGIELLPTEPWVERLGTTLLHFVWEGVLIAGVYAAVRRWPARARGPHFRYGLACVALAATAAAPLLTWILLGPDVVERAVKPLAYRLASGGSPGISRNRYGCIAGRTSSRSLAVPVQGSRNLVGRRRFFCFASVSAGLPPLAFAGGRPLPFRPNGSGLSSR